MMHLAFQTGSGEIMYVDNFYKPGSGWCVNAAVRYGLCDEWPNNADVMREITVYSVAAVISHA